MNPRLLLSLDFERALRMAAQGHRDQVRRGSGVPYIEHPLAVALILDRAGFDEEIVIAGLLHDLVEDTDITLDQVSDQFGDRVAEIVGHCSETKLDETGRKRPWIDRKRDHLAAVTRAPESARAVILADKLHNLLCIQLDLGEGRPAWDTFHADRASVLWYQGSMIDACTTDNPALRRLGDECRILLNRVSGEDVGNPRSDPEAP
ncbi:HD domain-containing protein [Tundrisphaera lichenicola]|uniref:HD domain-containing protein n=1 Tax=Tundrisphaera lichenicola TaxID=2029860 RepID=UPI003EB8DB46